jgi:transposase
MNLTELNTLPTPADMYAREHETYNEDNVKESIKLGRSTRKIAGMFQVSEQFVIKCRKELRSEGLI